jgi:hypothetical protein
MAENTLQDALDKISFKNSQIQKIKSLQEGKEKLKDSMGREKQKVSSATKLKGLQGLQGLQGLGSSVEK